MKKNNLLKAIGICFFLAVVLTWLIPAASYTGGTYSKGSTTPLGIFDWIRTPITTLTNYAGYAIYVFIIGGLYGVMNRTGVYSKYVNRLAKKYEKKKLVFAVISILFFSILSAVTGLSYVLLIAVPLFMAVLLELGYSKVSTIMSTIGAILVGNMASIYGFDICGYLNYYMELNINNLIGLKLIFFCLSVALLILFVKKHDGAAKKVVEKKPTRKAVKEEVVSERKIDIPLLDDDDYDVKSHKSELPMLILLGIAFIFLLVACYNWSYGVNFKKFEELYEQMTAVEINGYPIVSNILGYFNPLGYWSITEMSGVLLVTTVLIAWIYSLKWNEFVNAFKKGAKEVLPVAFYLLIANIVTAVVLGSNSGTSMYYTLAYEVLKHAGKVYNVVIAGAFGVLSSFFINEFPYVINYMGSNVMAAFPKTDLHPLIAFVLQSSYGLMMFILPTSALLLSALAYLNVSFKEWFKYIWKYVLTNGVLILIVYAILSVMM